MTGRQGDVGFVRCDIPAGAKPIKLRPFALGEKTGHSHRICFADEAKAEMYELLERTFLKVSDEGAISIQHEDHDPNGTTSVLPAGWQGEVIIAKEYDEENDFRRVED